MKKKFVVAVSENLNNWLAAGSFVLNTKTEGDVTVETVLLNEANGITPAYYSNSERVGDMANLYIMPWHSTELYDASRLVITRLSKPQQHVVLKKLHAKHYKKYNGDEKRMLLIPSFTSRIGNAGNQYNHPHDFSELDKAMYGGCYSFSRDLVIKPTDGARSMAQVVFNRNEYTLSEVMGIIDPSLKSTSPPPSTPATTSDGTPSASSKPENFFSMAEYPKGIKVFLGDAEAEEALRMFNKGCFVQPVVQSISAEFRILVNGRGICASSQRPRERTKTSGDYEAVSKEKDVLQFLDTGGSETDPVVFSILMSNSMSEIPGEREAYRSVFTDMYNFILDNLDMFRYNSLDVFVTSNGQWGIFEYCNQFSLADYGSENGNCNANALMRDWLSSVVLKLVDE